MNRFAALISLISLLLLALTADAQVVGRRLIRAKTAEAARALIGVDDSIVDVTSYGAVPDDGVNDFDAFEGAAYEAMTTGKVLWIPQGVFNFSESDVLELWADIRIDGGGPQAIIRHAGESAATATEVFRLTAATNVVIANIHLQNARYAVALRQPLPTAGKMRLDNVQFSGCRVGVYYLPPEPWSLPEQTMASLDLVRCTFTGVSTTTSAGVDLRNPAIDLITIEKSQFIGGQYGVSVQGYQVPTNQIPQQLTDRVVIRASTFTGQDHASSAHNGVFVSDASATVEECVFRDGSKGGSSSTDQAAVKLSSQLGKVHRCRFIRWGNNTDKPITVLFTGPGTEIDQFIGPSLTFNYDPGWFATLSESYFEDLYSSTTTTGCGRVYIESDDARITDNVWEKCYFGSNAAVYWKNTSPFTTFPRRLRLTGNQVKVCNFSSFFCEVNTKSQNIYAANNNVIGCEGSGGYLVSLDNSSSDVTVIDNSVQDSPNFSLLKLGTFSSSYTHTGVSVIRNTLTNCLYGVATTSGSSGNSGFVTNLVMEANRMWSVNSPLYILNYVTVADSRISDNFVQSAANAIPRLGTSPVFVNTEIFGNGVGLTTRRVPFHGTASSAPTYPVTGGIWLSNATQAFLYSGAAWVPLN